jgi:hypothetical protein
MDAIESAEVYLRWLGISTFVEDKYTYTVTLEQERKNSTDKKKYAT